MRASEFFVRKHSPVSKSVFVLMPFEEGMNAVYEHGIKPLVGGLGLNCKRADEMYTAQGILGDIWESIQSAEIVIADLTGKNPNVMYELGLCHSLWKKVILLSQNKDDVPFDLRAWRVIWYDFTFQGSARLQEELQRAIEALRSEPVEESEIVPLKGSGKEEEPEQPPTSDWLRGRVESWRPDVKWGFIRAGEEDFYFNGAYLFDDTMDPAEGKQAVFRPMEPLPDAKNRRAGNVFIFGARLTGTVTRLFEDKGFGFVEAMGHRGTHNLFVLVRSGSGVAEGSKIECTVSANERGPMGVDVQPIIESTLIEEGEVSV